MSEDSRPEVNDVSRQAVMPLVSVLAQEARDRRRDIIAGLYASGGGHYGGALSALDIILTLYLRILRVQPEAPNAVDRDRFILSKGHAAIALYAVLRRQGFFTTPLADYGRFGSPLQGHPDMCLLPGVDFSTGSLGQGLSVGLGMAMALAGSGPRVWVVLGDGECQEGQVWEAAMLAHRYRVETLHAVVDANGFQEWGWDDESNVMRETPSGLARKWESFGWRTFEVDGHDHEALITTFRAMEQTSGQPSVAIAKTFKGYGVPLIQADPRRFHCATVDGAEQESLLRSLR